MKWNASNFFIGLVTLSVSSMAFAKPMDFVTQESRSIQSLSDIDSSDLSSEDLESKLQEKYKNVIDQFQRILGLSENDKSYYDPASADQKSAFCKEFERDENTHKFIPSVFHTPMGKTGGKCELKDKDGKRLVKINCDLKKNCLMQGVCILDHKDGKRIGYNFIKFNERVNKYRNKSGRLITNVVKESVFAAFDNSRCPFGYGIWSKEHQTSICMDPFRSVAADTKFHKAGDVLFFPALRGLILPDKSVHNGFMTVRSSGGRIKGAHRFDFYTGICEKNHDTRLLCEDYGPKFFAEIGLAEYLKRKDKSCFYSYYKINDELKKFVLNERNFPNLPDSLVQKTILQTWSKFITLNTSSEALIAAPDEKSNEDLFF